MREHLKFALFLSCASALLLLSMLTGDGGEVGHKEGGKTPLFEVNGFRFVEYKNSERGVEVLGSVGYHFKDRDEIKLVKLLKKESGYEASVSALFANKVGNKIKMSGSVVFKRSDGYLLKTGLATYLTKEQILSIDSPFVLEGKSFVANGRHSTVDLAQKRVFIDTVKAKFIY